MSDTLESFEFFISQRGEVAVVTLVGTIAPTTMEKVDEFRRSMEGLRSKNVIINFRDVLALGEYFIAPFGQITERARSRGQLKISGLKPNYREVLHSVIREHELVNNLSEAVKDLMSPALKKAM